MPKHPNRLVAGLAATVAATAGLALNGPADAADATPLAVVGEIATTTSAALDTLAVYVQPEQDLVASLPIGGSAQPTRLPAGAVTVSSDSYQVAVDPVDLPDSAIGDTGLTTFEIVALAADGTSLDATAASVRAVYDGNGGLGWADPQAPTEDLVVFSGGTVPANPPHSATTSDTLLAPVAADLTALTGVEAPASALTDDETVLPDTDDAVETDDANQQEADATLAAASGCTPGQGAGNVKLAQKFRWGIIGTGYPVNGDWSTMTYTATSGVDYTTTIGMANDSPGYWQAKGTKAIVRSFGFDWDQQTYARAYKIGTEMYKIAHYYDRCPPSPPYYRSWEAGKYSGNAGENSGINRPDWTHCRNFTSTGKWWRETSDGKAYTLSYGVRMYNVIGVDLSTKRNYNDEGKLGYRVTSGRWLCGNNDVPGSASKVMERLNNA